ILAYLERLAGEDKALMPQPIDLYQQALRLIGLGLNACDKSVQIIYERDLRPPEKQHPAWSNRIQAQLTTAYDVLESYAAQTNTWLIGDRLSQADITVCVAWQFTQFTSPNVISPQ
ncbi:MAG: glutathione S-transferase C-terminal domain-containing protein, partial [Cyanobacteria bacterium J06598_1]